MICRKSGIWSLLFIAGLVISGCSTSTTTFVIYPPFWQKSSDYSAITVMPVVNRVQEDDYVASANQKIVSQMRTGHTYTVYDHTKDPSAPFVSNSNESSRLNLYTTILEYEASDWITPYVKKEVDTVYDEETETEEEIEHYYNVIEYGIKGTAEVRLDVDSTRDGAQAYSVTRYGICSDTKEIFEGDPEPALATREEIIECAILSAIRQATYPFFPHTIRVTLDNEEVMSFKHSGEDEDVIRDANFFIAIALPEEAQLNRFILEIAPKGGETIISRVFIWKTEEGEKVFEFEKENLKALSDNATKFTAKLLNGNNVANNSNVIFERTFKLK